MWTLEASDSAGQPVVFRIASGTVKTIGRATGAEFILDEPLISRLHCQLSAGDDIIDVKDLDSTNGTFINGSRVTTGVLKNGDELKVGRIPFKVSKKD